MNLQDKPLAVARIAQWIRRLLGENAYANFRRRTLSLKSNRSVFSKIYRDALWGSGETLSGAGSTLENSQVVRRALPELLRRLNAQSLIDAGCGDFNWMSTLALPDVAYIGIDVVPEIIRGNQQRYASAERAFLLADITRDPLPRADVVLCRHCLIHLPNRQVQAAIANFEKSGIQFLLATTFPALERNDDIWPGSFRPINLRSSPFNLPEPIAEIRDAANDDDPGAAILGLWRLS